MAITNLGGVYLYDDGFRSVMFAPLEGKILLYGSDIPSQTFTYTGKFDKRSLTDAFPDRKAACRAALHHTRGVLNKKKLYDSANRLSEKDKITVERLDVLREFIETCNCAPIRVMEKLIKMGFSDILGELDFYEESPAMLDTTQTLIDFINHMEGD